MYSETEVSEAADYLIAAMLVVQDSDSVDSFISEIGTDARIMPNAHYRAAYQSILQARSTGKVDALAVWSYLERNTDFQGGIAEMMRLQILIVETKPEAILGIYLPYTAILQANYEAKQKKMRAIQIANAEDIDAAILTEADRILAKQVTTDDESDEDYVPFPDDLLFDLFKPYVAAFQGRTEVPVAFHFAVLKTVIGASLGRRVYLDETRPTFPNFYTIIVGETGIARKSTALRLGEQLLADSDSAVLQLKSLSTPEGLLQVFVPPEGYRLGDSQSNDGDNMYDSSEQLAYMLDYAAPGVEGFRVLLSLDEFSYLLKKATKSHGEGIVQMLTEAYDYPVRLDLPTRVNPISADHPCLSLMAATTRAWLETSLKLEDIQGGFANRFSYYHATSNEFIFKSQPGNPKFLNIVKLAVNQLRQKFPTPTGFQFDEDAACEGVKWYNEHRTALKTERNPLTREALARADTHMRKAALLHAAITNDVADDWIHPDSLNWAIRLSEYLQAVTTQIYATFNLSEDRRLEQRIIDILEQKGLLTARELAQRIRWASTKEINSSLDELVKSGTLEAQKIGRTTKYLFLKTSL